MAATPIFILGRHRSGTTWLANVLASLPEIWAPSHERHRGVHESAFFSHLVPHCGHGRSEDDLRSIQRLFERSDFFALAGAGRGPDIVGGGAAAYFRAIMDAGAARHGARFWLEKTPANTLLARQLKEAFPDAIFIAIVRDHRLVVASLVHGFGDPASPRDWFRQSALTAIYEKIIAHNRVPVVRYESLVADYERTLRTVFGRLGIAAERMPRSRFAPNTSYADAPPGLRWWQSWAIAAGRWLVLPWPSGLLERRVTARRLRSRAALPRWFFAADQAADAGDVRRPP